MKWWHRLFHRNKHEKALDKELLFHIEQHTSDLIEQGYPPDEACRKARIDIGGPEQVKEQCRDARGTRWLENLFQDMRFAGRMWNKNRALTLFIICGLALAIGINTAIFTLVNAILFPVPQFENGNRIGYLSNLDISKDGEDLQMFSYPDYRDFKQRLKSFEELAAMRYTGLTLSDEANFPERYSAIQMTASTLSVIGQKPVIGRDLESADMQTGAPPVVILTHKIWENRYNKDRFVIGKNVRIDEKDTTIIGVTAPGVKHWMNNDLWLPLIETQITPAETKQSPRLNRRLTVFGKLSSGVSIGQANTEAGIVAQQLAKEYPATNKNISAKVQGFSEYVINWRLRNIMKILWCAITFVLLIACANVANLLLGRALIRSREISIRSAMGAGRMRVIRQLLTESIMLSVLAGVAGSILAYFAVRAFNSYADDKPDWIVLSVNKNILLYMTAVSILTGIIFGITPALRMSKVDLNAALREGGQVIGTGIRRRVLSAILLGSEVALSIVLLMGALLMTRSVMNTNELDLGINTTNILTMSIDLPTTKYKKPQDKISFFQELNTRINALPGVERSAIMIELPTYSNQSERTNTFQIETSPTSDKSKRPGTNVFTIGPGYFQCMQTQLLRGREFNALDGSTGHEAVIVNQSFADKYWPDKDPIGKRISIDDYGTVNWSTIIGVSSNIIHNSNTNVSPRIYIPYKQNPSSGMIVAARTRIAPESLATAFRKTVQELNTSLEIFSPRSIETHLKEQRRGSHVFTSMFALIAIIALVHVSMGLYAVISQSVNQRSREMAIRSAMGASKYHLWWLVLSRGMRQFGIGLLIGLALSLVVCRVLSFRLVGVSTSDPISYIIAISLMTIVALLACVLPVRRAAWSKPAEVLRLE